MQAFFGRHNPPDGFYSQERYSKEQLTAESATHFDHYTRIDKVRRLASALRASQSHWVHETASFP
jgi:hypothetical protein